MDDNEPAWVRQPSGISSPIISSSEKPASKDYICCFDSKLCYFRSFHILTSLVAALSLASNGMVLMLLEGFRESFLRAYAVLICIIIIMIEWDIRIVVESMLFVENWTTRGIFYLL